jgi:AcrR family transcriptional regulator
VAITGVSASTQRSNPAPGPRSTRERILTASLELFASRGFEGTDIVDIEERVGLTPGSGGFYRHFRNKQDVLHAAIEAEIERVRAYHAALGTAPTPHADAKEEVASRVELMLDMLWQMRHLMAVIAHDNTRFPELVPKIGAVMGDGGVAIDAAELSRLMGEGSIPNRPPDVVATIMMMAGVGYTLAETVFGRPIAHIDRASFGRVLTDLVTGLESS